MTDALYPRMPVALRDLPDDAAVWKSLADLVPADAENVSPIAVTLPDGFTGNLEVLKLVGAIAVSEDGKTVTLNTEAAPASVADETVEEEKAAPNAKFAVQRDEERRE